MLIPGIKMTYSVGELDVGKYKRKERKIAFWSYVQLGLYLETNIDSQFSFKYYQVLTLVNASS